MRRRILLWSPSIIVLLQLCSGQMENQPPAIVFSGTVENVGSVSFGQVPKSSDTATVRIESIEKKPTGVALKKGDEVTIKLKDPSSVHSGTKATFYTDPWILGSGVAVNEISHSESEYGASAAGHATATAEQMQEQVLQNRIASADAVIVGRVTEVRPIPRAMFANTTGPISEHNPNWHEAVIEVQTTLKGTDAKQLVVRFPSSMDVAWVNAPKFQQGQQGTFLLKKDEVTGAQSARLAGSEVATYTALKRGDVLSAADAARVKALLQK